jgi:hypothetical protein
MDGNNLQKCYFLLSIYCNFPSIQETMAWISFLTEFHEAESIGNTLVLFSDGTTGLRIHLQEVASGTGRGFLF